MESTKYKSRLAELRNREGYTQEEFAKILGIHPNTISSVENSRSYLKLEIGIEIAERYDVSLDWLYGLRDTSDILENFVSFFEIEEYKLASKYDSIAYDKTFLKMKLSSIMQDYLIKRAEIEEFRRKKGLPEVAYNAWLKEVKSEYSKKLKEVDKFETEFILIENEEEFGEYVAFAEALKNVPDLSDQIELLRINFHK